MVLLWYFGTFLFKGIVHREMKMLSSFSHPHVVPNLHEFLSYVEHKKSILKNAGNQTVDGPHWLPYYLYPFCGSQWGSTTVWYFKVLQNIFFCVHIRKKLIPVWMTWEWINDDNIFIFGWTISLLMASAIDSCMLCSYTKFESADFWSQEMPFPTEKKK